MPVRYQALLAVIMLATTLQFGSARAGWLDVFSVVAPAAGLLALPGVKAGADLVCAGDSTSAGLSKSQQTFHLPFSGNPTYYRKENSNTVRISNSSGVSVRVMARNTGCSARSDWATASNPLHSMQYKTIIFPKECRAEIAVTCKGCKGRVEKTANGNKTWFYICGSAINWKVRESSNSYNVNWKD